MRKATGLGSGCDEFSRSVRVVVRGRLPAHMHASFLHLLITSKEQARKCQEASISCFDDVKVSCFIAQISVDHLLVVGTESSRVSTCVAAFFVLLLYCSKKENHHDGSLVVFVYCMYHNLQYHHCGFLTSSYHS